MFAEGDVQPFEQRCVGHDAPSSENAERQTSLWMISATFSRPPGSLALPGSLHVKASGIDSLRFAMKSLSPSSMPGSRCGVW